MGPSRSCWNGTTSALQPKEITSKGTSFMCVLSIKVPIRKKFGNLFNDPHIYAGPWESIPPGTYLQDAMVIPDREDWWEKILPDTFRVLLKYSSLYYEGHYQHGAISGRNTWLSLGWSARTQNSWRTAYGC